MSVIIDMSASTEIIDSLKRNNIQYFLSCKHPNLPEPIATHPDMQIHFIDNKTAVVAPEVYEYYNNILGSEVEIIKGDTELSGTYPCDCAYNVTRLGKFIIGNLSYMDTKIKRLYQDKGFEFIHINQGYSKCSICVLDDFSVITEDEGIRRTLNSHNINVLKINPGSVELDGFPYGFIGGATGFVDRKTLGFCGNPSTEIYFKEMEEYIKSKSVNIICLSSTKLKDYGSILYF